MTNVQIAERRAKQFWVSLVVVLLGLQLIIGFFAIRLAISDRSVAIVPDYHNAALNWDAEHASRTIASRLGWTVETEISDTADDSGLWAVRITIHDESKRNVDGLSLSATAFHHARGDVTVAFDLQSMGDGQYQALAPIDRPGIWEIRFSFLIGDQPASVIRTLEVR